ncbi:hypothetical protein GcM1_245100, partial [Golovinomyces cichoracearum]
MVQYVGDKYETELQLEARYNGKKIVLFSQDESTCYANDASQYVWLEKGKSTLRKKGLGQSIMISAIICLCHGIMEWNGENSYETLEAGTNREGWWVADNVVKQVINVIKNFEKLHPDSIGLFQFDSSSNYHAMAVDSLLASKLNLSDLSQRHNIKARIRQSEAGSVPASTEDEMRALHTVAGDFKEEDSRPRIKKDKARISLTLCVNATGSDRLPIWITGKSKTPRALKG